MFPRLFTIALAILAFSDLAFGRIGSSAPNVFAPRPVDHSSNKAGDSKGRSRSLSKLGKLNDVAEKLKLDGRNEGLWKELKKGHQLMDAFGLDKEGHKMDWVHQAKLDKKKGPGGQLRKLKMANRRKMEEEDITVKEPPIHNLVIP